MGESKHISLYVRYRAESTVGRSKENSAKSRLWETLEGTGPGFFSDYIVRKQTEMGRGPRD